jgi:hypothetical protein
MDIQDSQRRNMQNEIYVKGALLAVFIVVVVSLSGCEDETPVQLATGDEVQTEAMAENIKETRLRDAAILIAKKYSINEKHVFAVLSEERKYKGPAHKLFAAAQGDVLIEDLSERLKRYSGKYGMSEKIVASILIDYKSMEEKDCP